MFKAFNLQPPVKSAMIEPNPEMGDGWVHLTVIYNTRRDDPTGTEINYRFPSDQAARIFFGKEVQKGVKWVLK